MSPAVPVPSCQALPHLQFLSYLIKRYLTPSSCPFLSSVTSVPVPSCQALPHLQFLSLLVKRYLTPSSCPFLSSVTSPPVPVPSYQAFPHLHFLSLDFQSLIRILLLLSISAVQSARSPSMVTDITRKMDWRTVRHISMRYFMSLNIVDIKT